MFATILYYRYFLLVLRHFLSHTFVKGEMCRHREPDSAHNIFMPKNVSFGA